jgi:hypothetical protein
MSGQSRKGARYRFSERHPDNSQVALAGTTAAAVPHVRSVSNHLTVRHPGAVKPVDVLDAPVNPSQGMSEPSAVARALAVG